MHDRQPTPTSIDLRTLNDDELCRLRARAQAELARRSLGSADRVVAHDEVDRFELTANEQMRLDELLRAVKNPSRRPEVRRLFIYNLMHRLSLTP